MSLSTSIWHLSLALSICLQVCLCMEYYEYAPPSCQQQDILVPGIAQALRVPIIAPTSCAKIPSVQNFELSRFLGRWYEIEEYVTPVPGLKCLTVDFQETYNGTISTYVSEAFNRELAIDEGISEFVPYVGEFTVFMTSMPSVTQAFIRTYQVIATDYENYCVLYTCKEGEIELAWIMSRRETLDDYFVDDVRKWIRSFGIETGRRKNTVQTNCPRRPFY